MSITSINHKITTKMSHGYNNKMLHKELLRYIKKEKCDEELSYVMNDIFKECCQNEKFVVRGYVKEGIPIFIHTLALVFMDKLNNREYYCIRKYNINKSVLNIAKNKVKNVLNGTKYEFTDGVLYDRFYLGIKFVADCGRMTLHNSLNNI